MTYHGKSKEELIAEMEYLERRWVRKMESDDLLRGYLEQALEELSLYKPKVTRNPTDDP